MTTTESNIWGGQSGHTYTLTPVANGGTSIDVQVVRQGKNLKGKLTGALLGTVGKSVLVKAFRNTVSAVELRYSQARTGGDDPVSR